MNCETTMPTFQSDFHRGYQSSNGKSIVDKGGRKRKMRCFIHFNIFSDFWGSLFGTNSDSNSVVLPGEVLNATRHVFFHVIKPGNRNNTGNRCWDSTQKCPISPLIVFQRIRVSGEIEHFVSGEIRHFRDRFRHLMLKH